MECVHEHLTIKSEAVFQSGVAGAAESTFQCEKCGEVFTKLQQVSPTQPDLRKVLKPEKLDI